MQTPEYVDLDSIVETGTLLKRVKFKPTQVFLGIGGLSLGLTTISYFLGFKMGFIIGLIMTVYSLFTILSIPDHWVASFYDDAVVFFSPEKKPRACRVQYKDVVEWNIGKKERNNIYMKLKNGREVLRKSFRWDNECMEILHKYLPGKETDELKQ